MGPFLTEFKQNFRIEIMSTIPETLFYNDTMQTLE